jgi:hypothetical protein
MLQKNRIYFRIQIESVLLYFIVKWNINGVKRIILMVAWEMGEEEERGREYEFGN